MKETLKNKSGISLIVLVITIIIMIILAAAVILALSSSDIVEKANQAKSSNDVATAKQVVTTAQAEWLLKSDAEKKATPYSGKFSNYAKEKLVLAGFKTTGAGRYGVTEEGKVLVGPAVDAMEKEAVVEEVNRLKIGDYVNYTPTTATSTTYKMWDEDSWEETDPFATQTGESALKWQYAGIDDKGNVLLLADKTTTGNLFLGGAEGYLQGPTKLNNLCKELYSGAMGEARSINVEDVNRIIGYTGDKGGYYSSLTNTWKGTPTPKTIGEIETSGEPALTDRLTPDGSDISKYKSDCYTYTGTTYKANTTTEYKLIFYAGDTTTNMYYWLASSCVEACFDDGCAGFDVRYVIGGYVSAYCLFYSNDGEDDYCGVRPAVSLKSNVQIGTKDGNGVWQLSQ